MIICKQWMMPMKIWETIIQRKKRLIVFEDMITHMKANKKLSSISTELFLRWRKLNISLVFVSKSYFKMPQTIRLNATHYFIIKMSNTGELQQLSSNHSSDIDFKDFMKLFIFSERYNFPIK